jgi:hypothetical protein
MIVSDVSLQFNGTNGTTINVEVANLQIGYYFEAPSPCANQISSLIAQAFNMSIASTNADIAANRNFPNGINPGTTYARFEYNMIQHMGEVS